MLEIQEPIDVFCLFRKSSILPSAFFWKDRQIKIEQINLTHSARDGNKLFYYFSVSSGGNFYRLKFDPSKMNWFLEAVEESD